VVVVAVAVAVAVVAVVVVVCAHVCGQERGIGECRDDAN